MKEVAPSLLCLLVTGLLFHPGHSHAAPPPVWTQWRGPARDAQVSSGLKWPDTLDKAHLKLSWRVRLGPSYSGPIVGPDKVFVTQTVDASKEQVVALDRDTGKELWRTSWTASIQLPSYAQPNGEWIRSTPAFDGDALYVGGMRDVLVCLDASTGKQRWRIDFAKTYKTPMPLFGMVSSPLVDGDAVYVQAAVGIIRVQKKTGKVDWRVLLDRINQFGGATASPIIATLAGKRQLVVLNRKVLAGLDLKTGKVLWRQNVPAYRNTTVLTPLILPGDGVFTSMFAGRSLRFNVNARGERLCVRLGWDHRLNGYMSSPILVNDHVYLHLQNQRVACFHARTGKLAWVTTRPYGRYWSMVAHKNRILALDQRGILYLIRANAAKFDLIDQRSISSADTWAHLAVCGDEVYIRELNALAVFRWREPAENTGPGVHGKQSSRR